VGSQGLINILLFNSPTNSPTKQRLNALTVGFFSCPYIIDQNCLLFPYNIVNNPYGANPDSVSIIVAFKFADICFFEWQRIVF
jgi:hypothetical protein